MEQLFHMLIESGALRRHDSEWLLLVDDETLVTPPSINAVLAARLDRLSGIERNVLDAAAVIGKPFSLDEISGLYADPSLDLTVLLAELTRKQWLRMERGEAQSRWAFHHVLGQEAAYQQIPKFTRANLHLRYSEWLQKAAAERSADASDVLGHHLELAYRYRKDLGPVNVETAALANRAAHWLGVAGRRACRRGDPSAGIKFLTRATALLPPNEARRLELLPVLGDALRESGDFIAARAQIDEAIERSHAMDDERLEALGLIERARLEMSLEASGWVESALAIADHVIGVLERVSDHPNLVRAWELKVEAHGSQGRMDLARRDIELGLPHAEVSQDLASQDTLRWYLGGPMTYGGGTVAEMFRFHDEQMSWSQAHGGGWVVEEAAISALAQAQGMIGRLEEARATYARLKKRLHDAGRIGVLAWVHCDHGYIERLSGEHAVAERELRVAYDLLSGFGAKSVSRAAGGLVHELYDQGRYDDAVAFAAQSREASPAGVREQALWRSGLAKVLAVQGHWMPL